MCSACNHPTYDGEPTCRDITAADVDLFEHDKKTPSHDVNTCTLRDCWNCKHWFGVERVIEESMREREFDADGWAS